MAKIGAGARAVEEPVCPVITRQIGMLPCWGGCAGFPKFLPDDRHVGTPAKIHHPGARDPKPLNGPLWIALGYITPYGDPSSFGAERRIDCKLAGVMKPTLRRSGRGKWGFYLGTKQNSPDRSGEFCDQFTRSPPGNARHPVRPCSPFRRW